MSVRCRRNGHLKSVLMLIVSPEANHRRVEGTKLVSIVLIF